MSKALWPAVSGAMARDHAVEVVANNLANMNTAGFKRDEVTFEEVLAKNQNPNQSLSFHPGPIKDKDLHPLEGRDQAFVKVGGVHTNFDQGGFKVTDNPFDLAFQGPGFLEVLTPSGAKFTRSGALKLTGDGKLTTSEGYPVLSARALPNPEDPASMTEDPAARILSVAGREGNFHVNDAGDVYMGEERVGKLSVVEFSNPKALRKSGSGIYENSDVKTNLQRTPANTSVRSGMIEASNVNPVSEISSLIKANRMFEMDLKAMKTVDGMMGKEVNELGKF